MESIVSHLSIDQALGITAAARPMFMAKTIHPPWSLVIGIGESSANSLGTDGETHENAADDESINKEAAQMKRIDENTFCIKFDILYLRLL